jgi:hypothetical protein
MATLSVLGLKRLFRRIAGHRSVGAFLVPIRVLSTECSGTMQFTRLG